MDTIVARSRRQSRRIRRRKGSISASDPLNDTWTLKTGAFDSPILFVDSVAVTEEVPAGGIVDVEIEVVNSAASLDPGDPDYCQDGVDGGFRYNVSASPSWTDGESVSECLGIGDFGSDRKTHEFSFTAPAEAGGEEIDITIETAESGNGGSKNYSVAVTDDGGEDEPVRPGPGDPDDGDGDGDGGGGGGGGGGGLLDIVFGDGNNTIPLIAIAVIMMSLAIVIRG